MIKCKEVNKELKPGVERVSLRGLLAPFSGEALSDVDEAQGWAVLSDFPTELFWALITAAWLVDVQLGGELLGLAPGFGFFSVSLAPCLEPLALETSRLAPAAPVPLTTGVAVDAAFAFAATLRSPGFFTFFPLDVWPSPGLLAVPSPSDFMADAVLRDDTLWPLCTGGLSGAVEGHFMVLCCKEKKRAFTHVKPDYRAGLLKSIFTKSSIAAGYRPNKGGNVMRSYSSISGMLWTLAKALNKSATLNCLSVWMVQ